MSADGDPLQRVGILPRSALRDQIEARLAQLEIDATVTWEQLEALTGKPRLALYSTTKSARDSLRRNAKMHFVTESGDGVRRISHAEAAKVVVPKGTRKIRNQANRNTRVIADLDLDQVAQADRLNVLAHASLAAFVRNSTTQKSIKALEAGQSEKALSPEEAAQRLYRQLKG